MFGLFESSLAKELKTADAIRDKVPTHFASAMRAAGVGLPTAGSGPSITDFETCKKLIGSKHLGVRRIIYEIAANLTDMAPLRDSMVQALATETSETDKCQLLTLVPKFSLPSAHEARVLAHYSCSPRESAAVKTRAVQVLASIEKPTTAHLAEVCSVFLRERIARPILSCYIKDLGLMTPALKDTLLEAIQNGTVLEAGRAVAVLLSDRNVPASEAPRTLIKDLLSKGFSPSDLTEKVRRAFDGTWEDIHYGLVLVCAFPSLRNKLHQEIFELGDVRSRALGTTSVRDVLLEVEQSCVILEGLADASASAAVFPTSKTARRFNLSAYPSGRAKVFSALEDFGSLSDKTPMPEIVERDLVRAAGLIYGDNNALRRRSERFVWHERETELGTDPNLTLHRQFWRLCLGKGDDGRGLDQFLTKLAGSGNRLYIDADVPISSANLLLLKKLELLVTTEAASGISPKMPLPYFLTEALQSVSATDRIVGAVIALAGAPLFKSVPQHFRNMREGQTSLEAGLKLIGLASTSPDDPHIIETIRTQLLAADSTLQYCAILATTYLGKAIDRVSAELTLAAMARNAHVAASAKSALSNAPDRATNDETFFSFISSLGFNSEMLQVELAG